MLIWIRGLRGLCFASGLGSVGRVGGCVQWSFLTPTGISASPWASFHRGRAQAWKGWVFLMKELPYGCIVTLQDVTATQLSIDIDKAKCDLEAFYNVKIGCDSNHLSYCSKTA